MRRALALAVCLCLSAASTARADDPFGLVMTGDAAESFLKTARVVKKKALAVGITRSHQYTLTDDTRTARAICARLPRV